MPLATMNFSATIDDLGIILDTLSAKRGGVVDLVTFEPDVLFTGGALARRSPTS